MEQNSNKADFAGQNGFIWWTGIVENREDPLKLGRCKVRCIGWHSENKSYLPSADLPWAMPLMPVNHTHTYAVKDGDMVFGFFLDGESAQSPVILGVFPSIPLKEANIQEAFSDSRDDERLKFYPRTVKTKEYKTDGSGIVLEDEEKSLLYPKHLDEPTTSRLARNDEETISQTFIEERKKNIVKDVPTFNSKWTEPETKYATKYPFNNVMETESGHIQEFDDTPGAERIHLAHRNGSFVEYFPDGDKVTKVTKDNYTVIMKDDNVYIMGECKVTVQGNAEVYVQENAFLKVDKNVKVEVFGNYDEYVKGTYKVRSDGNMSISAPNINIDADSTIKGKAGSYINLNAPKIDLN